MIKIDSIVIIGACQSDIVRLGAKIVVTIALTIENSIASNLCTTCVPLEHNLHMT